MGDRDVIFGKLLSYIMYNSPRRLLFTMSYYDFAAKLVGTGKKVLDIGCGEGLGTYLLARECGEAFGVDIDAEAIGAAKRNWPCDSVGFECTDFLKFQEHVGKWDAVVNFDVIEHILSENVGGFWQKLKAAVSPEGIAIVGTPNITSDVYASPVTKAGHVNLYSGERLEQEMREHFRHVFMFGANDEVVHTGFLPMAHYLIAVGCQKR